MKNEPIAFQFSLVTDCLAMIAWVILLVVLCPLLFLRDILGRRVDRIDDRHNGARTGR